MANFSMSSAIAIQFRGGEGESQELRDDPSEGGCDEGFPRFFSFAGMIE
jgi:hypothetical protein